MVDNTVLRDPNRVVFVNDRTRINQHQRGFIAAMGNMDGFHLGHLALIEETVSLADGGPVAAVIFDPHPRRLFIPDGPSFLLTTLEQKAELLLRYVDLVFVMDFSQALSHQTPEQFVSKTLKDKLGLKAVVVGNEFQFGKNRTGNAEVLQQLGSKYEIDVLTITPSLSTLHPDKYSSSQARQSIREGHPQDTIKILGRPWSVRGTVAEGKRLGRTIGFPTANIKITPLINPKQGVYAVKVLYKDHYYNGIANFGSRPTVKGDGLLLEVNIFDFNESIYDEQIEVEFYHFIRSEQKFDRLESLKEQIKLDIIAAKQLLAPLIP